MENSIPFELKTEFIQLIQLLKFLNIAESGAMASDLVSSEKVLCNGNIEIRKRYKVRKGDVIECLGQKVIVN